MTVTTSAFNREPGSIVMRELTADEIGEASGGAIQFKLFGYTYQMNSRGCWAIWEQGVSDGPILSGGPEDVC